MPQPARWRRISRSSWLPTGPRGACILPVPTSSRARPLPASAVLIVSGRDAHVSPDRYGLPDQVPTWNKVAVHLRGHLHPQPS